MKEKYTAYLPIWFVLMVPPMLILLLGWNFIMCGIGLMVGLLIIGLPDGFIKYSKNNFDNGKLEMMNVDFTRPFATQILKSGNILDEYQLGQTLIYIEYNNKKQLTDLYTRIKNRYLDDYKRIPQINQFAHNIFLNRHISLFPYFPRSEKKDG